MGFSVCFCFLNIRSTEKKKRKNLSSHVHQDCKNYNCGYGDRFGCKNPPCFIFYSGVDAASAKDEIKGQLGNRPSNWPYFVKPISFLPFALQIYVALESGCAACCHCFPPVSLLVSARGEKVDTASCRILDTLRYH